jgi:molybdate transport system substrate-binding protein
MLRTARALSGTLCLALAASALAGPPAHDLVVFEAASLKEAFAALAARFEKDHCAGADVFASADERHMHALVAAGLAGTPALFACNEPVVVVRSNLATLKTFGDLPLAERIVVGAPEVPIGAYTNRILDRATDKLGVLFPARVHAKIVSRELDVRHVLAKVILGEADAGVVYRTDAVSAKGKVRVLEIPPDINVRAAYPIASLKRAPNPGLAAAFVGLVRSPPGVAALREAGFVPCPAP